MCTYYLHGSGRKLQGYIDRVPYLVSQNRYESLCEDNNARNGQKQVFQQAMPSDAITLTDIMKELSLKLGLHT